MIHFMRKIRQILRSSSGENRPEKARETFLLLLFFQMLKYHILGVLDPELSQRTSASPGSEGRL